MDTGMTDIVDTKGLHQLTSFSGAVTMGHSAPETVEGYGWRDHNNWGPRNWQALPRHAFYTANFDEQRGFVLFKTDGGKGYFMHDGPRKIYEVTALDMKTQYKEDGREPKSMHTKVALDDGARHIIEGEPVGYIPLRNRRENMTTHLGYSLWKYKLDGKHDGFGIAEHVSQSKT